MPPELIGFFREMTPGGYGIWVGVLMFAGWLLREWRETRKLSSDDRLARREGYAKQVEGLTMENRALGADLRTLREEYDFYRRSCQAETDQLRNMILSLENQIAGYKRRVDSQAIEIARIKGVDVEAFAERHSMTITPKELPGD